MPFTESYRRQVALLVRALPIAAMEECFAIKGGTAINLFIRDMPRLSVDIDLTYLPVRPRRDSLAEIGAAMARMAEGLARRIAGAVITPSRLDAGQDPEQTIVKLLVRTREAQIKLEVTPVLRGCAYEPEIRPVSPRVQEDFGFAEMPVVSFPDLYGGKIVAALDRQHPRDLFDIRLLLANEGIDEHLRRAFIVYMLSHNRPMAEVLAPRRKDIAEEFLLGFAGMTDDPVSVEDLVSAREDLIREIVGRMPMRHRNFLVSFERGAAEWDLLGVAGAADLPAIRWRQQNLDRLSAADRRDLVARLEGVLAV